MDLGFLAVALAIGLATIGPGIGIGIAAAGAFSAMARQPESANNFRNLMFIAFAFAESLAIYGMLFAFIILGRL